MTQGQQPKGVPRRLIVARQLGKRTGQYKKGPRAGQDFTVYSWAVKDADGEPIEAKFESWEDCSAYIGKPTEYLVTFRDHEQYGRTYSLKPPRRDYGRELDELKARVLRLESQAGADSSTPGPPAPAGPPAGPGTIPGIPSQTPTPQRPASAIGGGEW